MVCNEEEEDHFFLILFSLRHMEEGVEEQTAYIYDSTGKNRETDRQTEQLQCIYSIYILDSSLKDVLSFPSYISTAIAIGKKSTCTKSGW